MRKTPCFQQPYIICVLYFSGKSETRVHLIPGKTGELRDLQGVRSGNFWKVQILVTDKKKGADSVHEPAILGLQGLETKNSEIDIKSTDATLCNKMQSGTKCPQIAFIAETGLEPVQPFGQGILNP